MIMRRVFNFFLLLVVIQTNTAAQDDILSDKYKLDFFVPDIPAFKALNIDASDILRPSDVKKFAVMLSPFYNNGKPGIPKNFALEFAPWKIQSKNWLLSDYYKNGLKRLSYNSSFSIGAVSDSTDHPSKVALGYRFSILSKNADPIRSDFITQQLDANLPGRFLRGDLVTFWLTKIVSQLPSYYLSHKDEFRTFLTKIEAEVAKKGLENDPSWFALKENLQNVFGEKFKMKELSDSLVTKYLDNSVEKIMDDYKENFWNATRFDGAISFVGESRDSAISSARFSSFNAWFTSSIRMKEKMQLLLGASLIMPHSDLSEDDKTPIDFNLNARLFRGNSNFRFFAEAQLTNRNYGEIDKSFLLNIGAEIRINEKFWIFTNTGIDNLYEKSKDNWFNRFVANLDLRYGFN
jgi:hypothetical protein